MYGAVALAYGGAQRQGVGRSVFQVDARCGKGAVERGVVYAEAGHGDEARIEVEGVLRIQPRHGFLLMVFPDLGFVGGLCQAVVLPQVIVVEAHAGREVVQFAEIGLVHELCVDILFVDVVEPQSVAGIGFVHRGCGHQCEVAAVGGVDDEGVFHVGLIVLGLYADAVASVAVGIVDGAVGGLSAAAVFVDGRKSAVEDVTSGLPEPSVLEIVLPHVGLVEKTVVVAVMVVPAVLEVGQDFGAQVVV